MEHETASRRSPTGLRGGQRHQSSVPLLLAGILIVGAAILGVLVSGIAASASDSPGAYAKTIAGVPTALCVDQGPLSVGHAMPSPYVAEGFETPEQAVRSLEATINTTATLAYHAHHAGADAHPTFDGLQPQGANGGSPPTLTEDELHELVALLAPSRSFRTSVSTAVEHDGDTKHLFDIPSSETGIVEARIVAERLSGLWRISEVHACASTFVTDFDRFQDLRQKETGR